MKTPQIEAMPGMTPLGIKPKPSAPAEKSAHTTPGPWFADGHYVIASLPDIYAGQSVAVTIDDGITGNSERLANARLIAAGPELLGQLKAVLADVDAGNGETAADSRWPEAHAAIAKAEGGAA